MKQAGGSEKILITAEQFQGIINNRTGLPAPTEARNQQVYYVHAENAYLICLQKEDDIYIWEKAADNNFDFNQKDSTDEITTNSLIPGSVIGKVRNTARQLLTGQLVLPQVNISRDELDTDIFYLCYFFGKVKTVEANGAPGYNYPFGTGGAYDLFGNLKVNQLLVYEAPGEIQRGLFYTQWEYYLKFMAQREEISVSIAFTLSDFLKFDYTNSLLIRNVEYFVKNPKFSMPLQEYTSMELMRL